MTSFENVSARAAAFGACVKTRCGDAFSESRRSHFAQEPRSGLEETSKDPLVVHIEGFSHGLFGWLDANNLVEPFNNLGQLFRGDLSQSLADPLDGQGANLANLDPRTFGKAR